MIRTICAAAAGIGRARTPTAATTEETETENTGKIPQKQTALWKNGDGPFFETEPDGNSLLLTDLPGISAFYRKQIKKPPLPTGNGGFSEIRNQKDRRGTSSGANCPDVFASRCGVVQSAVR